MSHSDFIDSCLLISSEELQPSQSRTREDWAHEDGAFNARGDQTTAWHSVTSLHGPHQKEEPHSVGTISSGATSPLHGQMPSMRTKMEPLAFDPSSTPQQRDQLNVERLNPEQPIRTAQQAYAGQSLDTAYQLSFGQNFWPYPTLEHPSEPFIHSYQSYDSGSSHPSNPQRQNDYVHMEHPTFWCPVEACGRSYKPHGLHKPFPRRARRNEHFKKVHKDHQIDLKAFDIRVASLPVRPSSDEMSINEQPGSYSSIDTGSVENGLNSPELLKARTAHERLSPDYKVQDRKFFQSGRVFTIISPGPSSAAVSGSDIYIAGHGEQINAAIQWFVVIKPGNSFSSCLAISTYEGHGVAKAGLRKVEHAIIYSGNDPPKPSPDEMPRNGEQPMLASIRVVPEKGRESIDSKARINFRKIYNVEHDVKVHNFGLIHEKSLHMFGINFGRVWRPIMSSDDSDEAYASDDMDEIYNPGFSIGSDTTKTPEIPMIRGEDREGRANVDAHRRLDGNHNVPLRVADFGESVRIVRAIRGRLNPEYVVITKPRPYFTRGRVFMALWSEPRSVSGYDQAVATDAEIYLKIRRFIVIRSRHLHCLCLLVTTYSGQATSKQGVLPDDHAPFVLQGQPVVLHKNEADLKKRAIHFKLENPDVRVSPMSRIDFSRLYTVEYAVKVRTIGRIVPEDLLLLEAHFRERMNMDDSDSPSQKTSDSNDLSQKHKTLERQQQPLANAIPQASHRGYTVSSPYYTSPIDHERDHNNRVPRTFPRVNPNLRSYENPSQDKVKSENNYYSSNPGPQNTPPFRWQRTTSLP